MTLRTTNTREPSPHRRLAIITAISVGAAIFVGARLSDLTGAVGMVGTLRPAPLVAAVALSVVAVVNRGAMSRAAHRAVGLQADLASMTRVSAAAYALNKVVKTGGIGGIALFVRHGESRRHPAGQVTAAYAVASLAAQLALLGIVFLAVGAMALTGDLSGAWLVVTAVIALLAGIALTAIVFAVRDRETVRRLHDLPFRAATRVAGWLGRSGASPNVDHADCFYDAAATLRRRPLAALPVLAHAVAGKLLGAAVLVASLASTGATIGLAKAFIVYVLALIASLIGIIPGGLGVVEASTGALLAGYGIHSTVAVAAVLTFRLLDLWLPLLIGLAASRALKARPSPESDLVGNRPGPAHMLA
ncbi:MAG: UPF0104 family protein [Actinomycetia bacterium]|nr:UPF0104 family protein [Actinomycetes bacterium]MCP5033437.1 UPF0104 family protein [Actinomycetes bacterium]